VTKPEAAQSLLGEGGIPNVAVISGGKVAAFRLEHVWVEAWVDYVPSRGAVNRSGDTWVPLDASFKQYTYAQGIDLKAAVPLDAQSLIDQIKAGATVNEQEGWVQNLNGAALQSRLTAYQNQVKAYIDQAKPNATVGDVLDTKQIAQQNPAILAGTLPYPTLATVAKLSALPDNLKWKFRTALADAWDNPLAALSQSTPSLAGKKLTLSFVPAAQADLDLINSYLPQPHPDGTPIQPSELPTSLPGYLIHLKTEIRVDGQLISQSTAVVTLGDTLVQHTAYFNPGTRQWEEGEANAPIAGEYHAIGLDLQGVSSSQLAALKTRLEQTKAKLEQFQANPNDPAPIQNLTKEDLSGDLLYSGILGYFASVDGSDQLAARANGDLVAYRLPSYGSFSATAQPHYWFGIVRSVNFPGVVMDVDRVAMHAEAKDADPAKRIAYLRQVGAAGSAFEHAVPERLFADPSKPLDDPSQPQGISAVKAIAIAASQGQRIYTLNQANQTLHASLLSQISIDQDARQEIENALAAGMEVTVHQSPISVNGWTGSGYIILDPGTGAGAYKISGEANGGGLSNATLGFLALTSLILFVNKLAFIGIIGAAVSPYLLAAVGLLAFSSLILTVLTDSEIEYKGEVATQIESFVTLAMVGSLAFIGGFGIVAVAAYTIMLLMIARLGFLVYV
jgi:hypothetical protein